MVRFPTHGPLPERLRAWCGKRYIQAHLSWAAAGPRQITWDGRTGLDDTSWLDHIGCPETLALIEACRQAGIWEPVE